MSVNAENTLLPAALMNMMKPLLRTDCAARGWTSVRNIQNMNTINRPATGANDLDFERGLLGTGHGKSMRISVE